MDRECVLDEENKRARERALPRETEQINTEQESKASERVKDELA